MLFKKFVLSVKLTNINMSLSVIDFSCYGLNVTDTSSVTADDINKLAEEVYEALSTWGFMYLSGHGIQDSEISTITRLYNNFFHLPDEFKSEYSTLGNKFNAIHGWSSTGREVFDHDRPHDLKESFDAQPFAHHENQEIWPNHSEIPSLKDQSMEFYTKCHQLALRILDIIAVGLQLEDKEFFSKFHNPMKYGENKTDLRNILYPAVHDIEVFPGQERCAEHTDYGSLTVLFQDDVGGLEVFCKKTGEYVAAKPIPGCVVVNIGDLMEKWTSGRLVATKHRVVVPKDVKQMTKPRQSIAFFVQPNDDTLVVPLDESSRGSPILSGVWVEKRYNQTYK